MLLYATNPRFFTLSDKSHVIMKELIRSAQSYFRSRPVYYIWFPFISGTSITSKVLEYSGTLELNIMQWKSFAGIHRMMVVSQKQTPFRQSAYKLKPAFGLFTKIQIIVNGEMVCADPKLYMESQRMVLKLGSFLQPNYKQQGVDLNAS